MRRMDELPKSILGGMLPKIRTYEVGSRSIPFLPFAVVVCGDKEPDEATEVQLPE